MNPGSTMRLGNCALVPGQHTVTFANVTLQTNAFISALGNENYYTQLLFIRTDQGKVTIQNYAPSIFNCNYLMYRNADDNKFYYAFVVQVVYVNENVCDVYFEIDALQTYMFDYKRNACMVLREHTNDDTIGANIMDEPVGTGELKAFDVISLEHNGYPNEYNMVALDQYTAFMYTGDDPYGKDLYPGIIDGCFTGGSVYYSPMPVDENWDNPYTDGVKNWLNEANDGHAGGIVSVFLYPMALCQDLGTAAEATPVNLFEIYNPLGVTTYYSQKKSFGVPRNESSLDGYVPRNNKLFTYPYTFLRMTNNNGQYQDFRWEFFVPAADVGDYGFYIEGTIDPTGDVFCYPISYNHGGSPIDCRDMKLSIGGLMQVPWAFNSYSNWQAQNAAGIAFDLISGAVSLIPGAGLAVGATKIGLSTAASAAGRVAAKKAAGEVAGTFSKGRFVANSVGNAFASPMGQLAAGSAAYGATRIGSTVATMIDQSNVPNRVEGHATNCGLMGINRNTFTFINYCVRKQIAEMIDDYFDMYGYATNRIKVPNETGRASWNYVETADACFTGDVPAPYMREINAMYDAGITFWHDLSYVGDYNRDNSIV